MRTINMQSAPASHEVSNTCFIWIFDCENTQPVPGGGTV